MSEHPPIPESAIRHDTEPFNPHAINEERLRIWNGRYDRELVYAFTGMPWFYRPPQLALPLGETERRRRRWAELGAAIERLNTPLTGFTVGWQDGGPAVDGVWTRTYHRPAFNPDELWSLERIREHRLQPYTELIGAVLEDANLVLHITREDQPVTTIREFIEQRVNEDQARANAANPGPWELNDRGYTVRIIGGGDQYRTVASWEQDQLPRGLDFLTDDPNVRHIVAEDPAATLRRCVMVRAMLQRGEEAAALEIDRDEAVGDIPEPDGLAMRILRDIAAYWDWHPEYQEEWVPVPEFTGPPTPLCQHANVVAHGNEGGQYRWHCADCQLTYTYPRNLADCDVVYFLGRVAEQKRDTRS